MNNINGAVLFKTICAVIAVIAAWFFVGKVMSQDDLHQLLGCMVVGFGLAAIIYP